MSVTSEDSRGESEASGARVFYQKTTERSEHRVYKRETSVSLKM